MTALEKAILAAMIDTGRAREGWRVKVQDLYIAPGSDWATVQASVVKPRCRNPIAAWELAVYMPRQQINWGRSTFVPFA